MEMRMPSTDIENITSRSGCSLRADRPMQSPRRQQSTTWPLRASRFAARYIGAVSLALAVAAGAAHAQAGRNITLVVPFSAGGSTDVIARLVAEHMSRTLGQTIIVENIGGAGGTIASERVAKAAPDGNTIMINQLALLAAPSLFANLKFDTKTAFSPVGLVNTGPTVIVAKKDLPAASPAEVIAWMRANGEKVTFGHGGLGTSGHLCGLQLAKALSVTPNFVPYRGGAPAMNDLMGGSLDLLCDQSTNTIPQITGATVRGVGVTGPVRLDSIKDVPTTAEIGIAGVNLAVWHGLYVPRATPPEIVEKLNGALRSAVADAAVVARFNQLGSSPFPEAERSVAAHQALFDREFVRTETLLREAGVQPAELK
jgi:tripartite-type tricarboxylate transporter receptor subunit TctC